MYHPLEFCPRKFNIDLIILSLYLVILLNKQLFSRKILKVGLFYFYSYWYNLHCLINQGTTPNLRCLLYYLYILYHWIFLHVNIEQASYFILLCESRSLPFPFQLLFLFKEYSDRSTKTCYDLLLSLMYRSGFLDQFYYWTLPCSDGIF